jgi:4-carboxymuconolactone decarboxylase
MEEQNVIFPQGKPALPDFFTGTAYLQTLVADTEKQIHCQVHNVNFRTAARNNWHKHTGEQILLITGGKG